MNSSTPLGIPRLGAWGEGGTQQVRVWAPEETAPRLILYEPDGRRVLRELSMTAEPRGFFSASIPNPPDPFLYKVSVKGQPAPDPWSRHQPFGVHGPSGSVSDAFPWTDAGWKGLRAEELVLYEVHVGTVTREGTFDGLRSLLPDLKRLGVTALELMPIATFPGRRNWGYDGVSLFAPAQVYGGPDGLRRLIDAAHAEGLGVILDVVYNHFGPEGNYLSSYSSRYFTAEHHTPWGEAINYADPSGVVRELPLTNAEMWIRDYHADGLRLDATHAIVDPSQPHLLREVVQRAKAAAPHRSVLITAEDERNQVGLITSADKGGEGVDAVWADDLHHQLRRAFAGDSDGYFRDYTGSVEAIVTTLQQGWFYQGQPTRHGGHPRGTVAALTPPSRFIHCIQNHDQVGNRPLGNRLGEDVSPEAFRAMSALLLFSPYTPLIFAGQEWNTRTPFLYFTHHNPELGQCVTEGRRREFAEFAAFAGEEVPDPQARETFERSVLDWTERTRPGFSGTLALYETLLTLRKSHPALRQPDRESFEVRALGENGLSVERRGGGERLVLLLNVRDSLSFELRPGEGVLLDTAEPRFGGRGGALLEGRVLKLAGPSAAILQSKG